MLTFPAIRPALSLAVLTRGIAVQRGHLFLFVPVCLALGIGAYFSLPRDPAWTEWVALALGTGVLLAVLWVTPEDVAPLVLAVALVGTGLLVAGLRVYLVSAPVLTYRYYGAIEGRIVKIDRSASDALRLTLDQVVLERLDGAATPDRVRVSLHGQQGFIDPVPGLRVMLTGHLAPPPAPSEPGGFDFRRLAWFERLGAVGYTRSPVLARAPPQHGAAGLRIHRLRMQISSAVQDRLPGDAGGFAGAILTGDRSGISQARMEELRRSNLAHLLAISGLHMGLLTGFVFGLLRLLMALVPWFALRAPTRKIAALGALGAGVFYLLLSGGNVATERAFIMVAVMFGAVLLDRRAISLRSVAMAAILILVLRPEALVQAGFQMSFAATVALVAVFRALSAERAWRRSIPRWLWPIVSVIICSMVAGIATAPVAAASFNRLAEYGLIANLAAVPLMGLVIMPAAVLAAVLAPFGLEWVGLRVMEPAIGWILRVAETVSGFDGAVMPVVQPAPWVLPLLALGGVWMVVWRGGGAWLGATVTALAVLGWAQASGRPHLLITADGVVLGLMGDQGRMISRGRAGSFAAESWLQADGDGASQADAFARTGVKDTRSPVVHLRRNGLDVVHLLGQRGLDYLPALCLEGRFVVTSAQPEAVQGACHIITPRDLRASGAIAMTLRDNGVLVMRTVADTSGQRPWTHQ
ncbi:ComEC/Rec2 family competence protein [Roseinatronobacter alkalisoli]|uniref:ComEC/Rec2 family competence protein n=1 Tax=Roseinatronobacter alkalisoli TaxID=3028235 RepID=A0ABT5T3K7_9RHOB|nr:ComEC/Rec2 family competence protein [Roseinatronobacter sp. HJB301]MDD7969705.1 ComEC/Rec2 family competence protein [Roseinatronobacter sp. HJB301]